MSTTNSKKRHYRYVAFSGLLLLATTVSYASNDTNSVLLPIEDNAVIATAPDTQDEPIEVLDVDTTTSIASSESSNQVQRLVSNLFSQDTITSIKQSGTNPTLYVIAGGAALLLLFATLGVRRQRRRMQDMLECLPDAVAIFNPKGQLTAINTKLLKLLSKEVNHEILPTTTSSDIYSQLSPNNDAIEQARHRAQQERSDPDSTITFELLNYDEDPMLVKERPTRSGGKTISVYGSPHVNMNSNRLSDPLTDLPNRAKLLNELAQRCSRTKDELALVVVDLRSFRQINDTYGRETGDEVLKQTALCLQYCMPDHALIARIAGDEFAALIEFSHPREQIEHRISRFLATLRSGLNANALNIPVRASVGIAFAPEHGNTVSLLLKCADSACAHAKHLGNNSLVVYNSDQQRQSKRRHQLEVGLQQAIARDELLLNYQPQIDIATKMTCGMEALLRWDSKEFGRVSPAEFIPVAEQSGIIKPIGEWVLNKAIADYQRLAQYGMPPPSLSVNLSRKQFNDGELVNEVARILDRSGFDPSQLCLEITETALFSDSTALKKYLLALSGLGIKLSIDDFGVGYTTLLELRDSPFNEIKIDRAFVMDLANDRKSQDFIRAIVDIADSIGADVVAEGIENQLQLDLVTELGCHRAQGYYLCHPMQATTFPDLVLSA